MKAQYLGHVVFYVKDLEQSLTFYRDLLGFKEVGRIFNGAAAALTSGRTHHELLLIQVGDAPAPPSGRRLGLYHIGIALQRLIIPSTEPFITFDRAEQCSQRP